MTCLLPTLREYRKVSIRKCAMPSSLKLIKSDPSPRVSKLVICLRKLDGVSWFLIEVARPKTTSSVILFVDLELVRSRVELLADPIDFLNIIKFLELKKNSDPKQFLLVKHSEIHPSFCEKKWGKIDK